MKEMLDTLRQKGVKPVMMTLPPIDAARYLAHICRDGLSREAIMSWLREVQMIYRHQELYSDAAARLAMSEGVAPSMGGRVIITGLTPFCRASGIWASSWPRTASTWPCPATGSSLISWRRREPAPERLSA